MKSWMGNRGEETFILSHHVSDSMVNRFLVQRQALSHEFKPNAPSGNNFRGYTMVTSSSLPKPLVQHYLTDIDSMLIEYQVRYKESVPKAPGVLIKPMSMFNFQHYQPGACYHVWHSEYPGPEKHRPTRVLAFMTYLNDVNEGGETEFLYYKLNIQPRRGLTLMWPAGFTHTHRGCPTPEEKMIITGWCIYLPIE